MKCLWKTKHGSDNFLDVFLSLYVGIITTPSFTLSRNIKRYLANIRKYKQKVRLNSFNQQK